MLNPVTATIGKNHYKTGLSFHNHHLIADEPETVGGTDLGPSAGTFLKMSLASCTAITLRMYADRKGWDVEEITVEVDYEKTEEGTVFHRQIQFKGNLDDGQKQRLYQIANACPIHKTLTQPIKIVSHFNPSKE